LSTPALALAFLQLMMQIALLPATFRDVRRAANRTILRAGITLEEREDWARYTTNDEVAVLEIGPLDPKRQVPKVMLTCHFADRDVAMTFARDAVHALGEPIHPSLPTDDDGTSELTHLATTVVRRHPLGIEVYVLREETGWRTTIVILAGGPRVVMPLKTLLQ
jgi:hypothetical protein